MEHQMRPLAFRPDILTEQLRALGYAGVLLTSPESIYYTTGFPALPDSGNPILFALRNQLPAFVYLSAAGRATLVCWIGATLGFSFGVDETRSCFDLNSAVEEVRDLLREQLPEGARVGVESTCPAYVLNVVLERTDPANVVFADELILRQRLRKSAAELARMRRATEIVEATTAELRKHIAVGASRLKVISAAKRIMLEQGASGIDHTTIAFGAANPEIAVDETLLAGQLVTLDLGASVEGYVSDNRRLLYTGPVPDDLRALHATMCAIVARVGAAAIPGTPFADLYALAVELYGEHGLPPFFLSAGHSLGLQVEEAWITGESALTVEPGMVLNIELYSPASDGTSIGDEETYLITEASSQCLTTSDPAIRSM
jgi:Xaa-Pro aminopeptidase